MPETGIEKELEERPRHSTGLLASFPFLLACYAAALRFAARCSTCKDTCPVHVIWPFMETWADGCQPFVAIDGNMALFWLRQALAELGIPDARKYRTHDLRRVEECCGVVESSGAAKVTEQLSSADVGEQHVEKALVLGTPAQIHQEGMIDLLEMTI